MANPQVENGYTRIANELLEAVYKADLSGNELRIFLAILRLTYGHSRCQAAISITMLMRETGIDRKGVVRGLRVIENRNMIRVDRNGYVNVIGPQKDFEQWKTGGTHATSGIHATTQDSGTHATKTSGIRATTIKKKESIYVFNYWNTKEIIRHRSLNDKTKRAINARLREGWRPEEIYRAIDNYAAVLRDPACYWNHRWTLAEFLQRGLDRFCDDARPLENFRKEKTGKEACRNAGAPYPRERMADSTLRVCGCGLCRAELERREHEDQ